MWTIDKWGDWLMMIGLMWVSSFRNVWVLPASKLFFFQFSLQWNPKNGERCVCHQKKVPRYVRGRNWVLPIYLQSPKKWLLSTLGTDNHQLWSDWYVKACCSFENIYCIVYILKVSVVVFHKEKDIICEEEMWKATILWKTYSFGEAFFLKIFNKSLLK